MREPKVLYIPIKGKWFDMIEALIKKEEYRKISPHWISRLIVPELRPQIETVEDILKAILDSPDSVFEKYDYAILHNGYGNVPKLKITFPKVHIGRAKPEWSDGAEGTFFVITFKDVIRIK